MRKRSLVRLCGCAGWVEPPLSAHPRRYDFPHYVPTGFISETQNVELLMKVLFYLFFFFFFFFCLRCLKPLSSQVRKQRNLNNVFKKGNLRTVKICLLNPVNGAWIVYITLCDKTVSPRSKHFVKSSAHVNASLVFDKMVYNWIQRTISV